MNWMRLMYQLPFDWNGMRECLTPVHIPPNTSHYNEEDWYELATGEGFQVATWEEMMYHVEFPANN